MALRHGRGAYAVIGAFAVVLACTCAAQAASLPSVSTGQRPGPDLLYAAAPKAPQLENAAPFTADPILVSGASAYRKGEFLYQDFLYDDHGAFGVQDPSDPQSGAQFLFSPKRGTLTYPTDPVYASNAADLVELRVKPLADSTAFRVTLNTVKDAERAAFTIALGSSAGPRPWPHGAGVSSPAQMFLTVHGSTAELRDATTGTPVAPAPSATMSAERRQWDVRVPHAAWNPGAGTVRMAAGTGLWDAASGRYLTPTPGPASATRPGGGAPTSAALFNLAFRFDEPLPKIADPGVANTVAEGGVGVALDATWWRERAQGDALQSGDVTRFAANVDFAKLAAAAEDDSGVPKTGPLNRIFASRHVVGQGVEHARSCTVQGVSNAKELCEPRFVGQLQPYALYVPKKAPPAGGYGMTLLLHGLSANHNEFLDSKHAGQFGERGSGSIVASPNGRGPDGFYSGSAEGDVFEVWADVARHYPLDAEWAATSGYSMGGIGSFRLASRFPDLFARAAPVVGFPSGSDQLVPSLRHVPVMMWNAGQDELVNPAFTESGRAALEKAGLRYELWLFTQGGHITLGNNDEYGPMAQFLGEHRVDRSPAHVTYVVDRTEDWNVGSSVGDHAYWLSGIAPRDAKTPGQIDAVSKAFGTGDPKVLPEQVDSGTLTGGSHGPLVYARRAQRFGPVPSAAKANVLQVKAKGVSRASVDVKRARLGCDAEVKIDADGPFDLALEGCGVTVAAGSCLPTKARAGSRGIGRVRIARTRAKLLRLPAKPARRSRDAFTWCVKGSKGKVGAVFSKRSRKGKARLVVSSARTHRSGRVAAGNSRKRVARAFPRRRRVAPGVFRTAPGSRRIVGIRRGKVRFVGVADAKLLRKPSALRRDLRRAGL